MREEEEAGEFVVADAARLPDSLCSQWEDSPL